MVLTFGSCNPLEKLIEKHLFIICPNNSGSTLLQRALATSKETWNLNKEAQHTFGFAGPSANGLGVGKRWAAHQNCIDLFTNPENYDWSAIRKALYFQSFSRSEHARIFVIKSPPFLLIVDQLANNFTNSRFLFMVRDPYPVVEAIVRKMPMRWKKSVADSTVIERAALHVINCMKYQRRNLEKSRGKSIFFSYEKMCEEPETVAQMIQKLVPEIDDLDMRQRFKVKTYHEEIRNMNDQQTERLSDDDLKQINKVFRPQRELLDFFGYSLRN